jgi:hypothetical protein
MLERGAMRDFSLRVGNTTAVFRFGIEFVEGDGRLCWTMAGIDRLIAVGLWRRGFDLRGNLKSKPITVEAAMRQSA